MYSSLNIVMPVFNEDEIVGVVIDEWCDKMDKLNIDYSFHIFDDGSTDNTREIVNKRIVNNKRIYLHANSNKGHGPTIIQAYVKVSNCEWIMQIDSDNEISPNHFSEFWKNKDEYDLVIGRRDNYNVNLIRTFVTKSAYFLIKFMFGGRIRDTNVPYRLFRVESDKEIFNMIPRDSYISNILLSGITNSLNLRVKEFSIEHNIRTTGRSMFVGYRFFKGVIQSTYEVFQLRYYMNKQLIIL